MDLYTIITLFSLKVLLTLFHRYNLNDMCYYILNKGDIVNLEFDLD